MDALLCVPSYLVSSDLARMSHQHSYYTRLKQEIILRESKWVKFSMNMPITLVVINKAVEIVCTWNFYTCKGS